MKSMAAPALVDQSPETHYLVWLDASVNTVQESIDAQRHLRSIVTHLQTFEHVPDCEQFLQQSPKDDRIFFVVSGRLGQEIMPRIHDVRQICAIYVYCMDKKRNEVWAKQFTKIRGVFVKLDDLCQQIRKDQSKRWENRVDEPLPLTISKLSDTAEKSTTDLNMDFLYSQLLIDCLIRMRPMPSDTNELTSTCRKLYENSPTELALLKEFEGTYSSSRAVWWYTRESFLFRLLNKALRVKNIDLLFLFRFFIRDLDQQLRSHQCAAPVRVYRGQLMSDDELSRLAESLGEYLSINSFLSTTLSRQRALAFLKDTSFSHHLQAVLFEIDADPAESPSKTFADITALSYYPAEREILFVLGSVFRLMNIKQEKNGLWIVQMVLSSHRDGNLQHLFDTIKDEQMGVNEQTSLISLGNLLHQMGNYDLAEKYFHRLIAELPDNPRLLAQAYCALGVLALLKGQNESSLNWHEKSLQIDPHSASSYNCIGCLYQKRGELQTAVEFYTKAWHAWRERCGDDYYQIADVLNNLGCIYELEKDYPKALEYHRKSLAIRQKWLPKAHCDLGASYNNIANVYLCLAQYDLALQNYQSSLEIKYKSLPSEHVSLASTLQNIGIVYDQMQCYGQALTYYERAARLLRAAFPSTHPDVLEVEEDIRRVSPLVDVPDRSTYF